MEIFIIRSTHVKPTFFETLGVLTYKKKSVRKIFLKCIFSVRTTLMNVLQLRQKNFSTYPKYTYFGVFFTAESISTLSFAIRAQFLGLKWTFSVLNAEKLKKFSRFRPLAASIKKYTFQKIGGHTFFFWHLNIWSFEWSVFYMCAPNFENWQFWTSYLTYFFEKPTYVKQETGHFQKKKINVKINRATPPSSNNSNNNNKSS